VYFVRGQDVYGAPYRDKKIVGVFVRFRAPRDEQGFSTLGVSD
jgi:hypothetical protein